MKLNIRNTVKIGMIFLSISLFWQVYDGIISKIVDNIFHLSNSVRGIIMSLDNVVALFLLPTFGFLSDKTNTKFGKRTPYIFFGTILASFAFLFVGIFTVTENFVGFMIALMLTLVFMSIYRSPAVALMPDITLKPLRTKGNLVINFMGGIGSAASLLIIATLLKDNTSYMPIFLIVSGIMLVCLVVFLLTVREPKLTNELSAQEALLGEVEEEILDPIEKKEKDKERLISMIFLLVAVFMWFMSFNALMSSFSLFAEKVWNIDGGKFTIPLMFALILSLAITIPLLILGKKWTRKTSILVGIVEMLVSTALMFLIGSNIFKVNVDFSSKMMKNIMFYVITFIFAICASGWSIININSYPMVVEMSGSKTVGKFTGYYYTASMTAQIITPFLSGIMIDIFSMKILFLYAAVFAFFAFFAMFRVMHGNNETIKHHKLKRG